MRNLTIKREKSFVGSLAKMKVFIEDVTSSEIVINNVSYRKIGELKNGEEKIFSINENECNIAVIADKTSKNFCNELYKIPAGENDIFLSGKNVFNLATGNAFRFNNVTDSNVLQNRKKGFRKGIFILCIFFVIGAVGGFIIPNLLFQGASSKPKEFTKEGMTITLNNRFREVSNDKFTTCYESQDFAVLVLKEEFSLYEDLQKFTLSDYGDILITNNKLDSSIKLESIDGLTYFEYQSTNPETKDLYVYFTLVSKTSDAFWMIQFVALEKNYNDNKQTIIDWAKTIKFSNS